MLKVAFVEDELFMREFLESCMDYRKIDVEICGSFCCAEDALTALHTQMPDLIVTDIKMPGMDGITFMSEVLKINPETHFLVISNYQNFEIVREAFRVGICDYIPKIDFELEDYREILLTCVRSKRENETKGQQEQSNDLKERFWGEGTHDTKNPWNDFDEQKMIFALIEILNYETIVQQDWEMDKEELKQSVSECLKTILHDFGDGDFFFNEYGKIVVLFSEKNASEVRILLTDIRRTFQEDFRFILCLFLEENYTHLRNLKVRYTDLYAMRKYRFFLPKDTVITKNSARGFRDSFDYLSNYTETEALFRKNEYDAILEKIMKIKNIKPEDSCLEEVLYFYQNLFLLICAVTKAQNIDFIQTSEIKELLALSNYEEVSEILISTVKKISENMFFPKKKLEQNIDEYLREHYSEKITLEDLAKSFQYEYSYFSKMFRKMKGTTFRKYLNHIRLEKAESLIRNTNLKYSEIALEVGYQNYEHFSRSFREKYGYWPNESERTGKDD